MGSVLWAGPRRKTSKNEPVRMTISVVTDEFSYELRCGLPTPRITMFTQDPEVKEEYVWHGPVRRPSNTFFQRDHSGCWVRDREARRIPYSGELSKNESVLSQLREPHLYPELSLLRAETARWRFYHHFRTDPHSPVRHPQPGVWTPILSHDGQDLAAALQTILESKKASDLEATIAAAFGGAPPRGPGGRAEVSDADADAGPAALASGPGVFGWDATLPLPGCGVAEPAPREPSGTERIGDQPAPGSAGPAGQADRCGPKRFADLDDHPLRFTGETRRAFLGKKADHAGTGRRGHSSGGTGV